MCTAWPIVAKILELGGALLLILPLYKAIFIQWSYLHAADRHTRAVIARLAEPHAPSHSPDVLSLLATTFAAQPLIKSNTFSVFDRIIIVSATLLLFAGGAAEILERAHSHMRLCQWLSFG